MLSDRVAIVTGASAGIGLSVCRKLIEQGAKIAMVARTEKTLRESAMVLGAGDRVLSIALDVGNLLALEELPQQVVSHFGRLDYVINNAGLHHRGPLASRTAEDLAAMVNVNLVAPIVLLRAALPLLQRGSVVVNVASLAGFVPLSGAATYSATKAGLRWFGRATNEELRSQGITVCTVSPGPVDTDFFLNELDSVAPITFSQPMSTPDEVAEKVLECLRTGRQEIAVPWFSGKLATLGYISPTILRILKPMMEKKGTKKKAEYAERKPKKASRQK